ncbi:MAG: hypothetical protein KJZ64_12105 [Sphingomonadaceae bacterium]|nr:hypothetical protein [Sphingomonadaceae bacterium]
MPYESKSEILDHRTFALNFLWLTFGASLVFLGGSLVESSNFIIRLAGAFTGGGMVAMLLLPLLKKGADEYHLDLISAGAYLAVGTTGILMLPHVFVNAGPLQITDPSLSFAIVGAAFNVGIACKRISGR